MLSHSGEFGYCLLWRISGIGLWWFAVLGGKKAKEFYWKNTAANRYLGENMAAGTMPGTDHIDSISGLHIDFLNSTPNSQSLPRLPPSPYHLSTVSYLHNNLFITPPALSLPAALHFSIFLTYIFLACSYKPCIPSSHLPVFTFPFAS